MSLSLGRHFYVLELTFCALRRTASDVLVATYVSIPICMHRAGQIRKLMCGEFARAKCGSNPQSGSADVSIALVERID